MDSRNVGMVVGASALGAALAYLGLQKYPNDESTEDDKKEENVKEENLYNEIDEPKDVTEDITKNMKIPVENVVSGQTEFETIDELNLDNERVKKEVKNAIRQNTWSGYWKNEYTNAKEGDTIKVTNNFN